MKVYIASPFFNEEQKKIVSNIEEICHHNNVDFYSPMKECLYVPGVTDTKDIFIENIKQIKQCDAVIVVTDGKDVGTLFEAGFAFGIDCQIIYLWLNNKGQKFNLMLKESADAVCLSFETLHIVLKNFEQTGLVEKVTFNGEFE